MRDIYLVCGPAAPSSFNPERRMTCNLVVADNRAHAARLSPWPTSKCMVLAQDDKVSGGEPGTEDYDEGVIVELHEDGDATVAWSNMTQTKQVGWCLSVHAAHDAARDTPPLTPR